MMHGVAIIITAHINRVFVGKIVDCFISQYDENRSKS